MNSEPRDPHETPAAKTPEPPASGAVTPDPAPAAPALTAEEQMALFEQELKETDWGHQPC
ncbi:MAG: hypothetical protein ACREH8_08885 [Opitutaceae bacterium]